ncbi:D-threonate kinase [Halanaerocella petrolearia]
MPIELGIIADDFTGANDTGVQFSKKELKTLVVSDIDSIKEIDYQADIIVVDTDSRADKQNDAYDKVFKAAKSLKTMGINYIYKKLDSTLRGNIGTEIEAAMKGGGYEIAIVAPALPAAGRETIGGNQLVHSVPLEKTEIAQDPVTPVKHSYVADIIREQTEKELAVINIKDVIKGSKKLANLIKKEIKSGSKILVLDSITNQDLDIIANTLGLISQKCLLVGSAGFAESLPIALNLVSKQVTNQQGSVVGIAGSVSDVTREQINYAQEKLTNLEVLDVEIEKVLQNDYQEELNRIVDLVSQFLNQRHDIIIRSAKDRKLVKKARQLGSKQGLSSVEVSEKIAKFLGAIAGEIYLNKSIGGLLLTGGDIAVKSASLLGARATIIEGEVLPGIPVGYFKGNNLPQKPIVTKAGAFGEEEAIVKIIENLKRRG